MNYQGDANLSHANGGCYVCLRGDSLVDTGVQIVAEGILALCKGCITDAAQAASLYFNVAYVADLQIKHAEERRLYSPEAAEDLAQKVAVSEAALANAETTIAALKDVIAGFKPKPAPRAKAKASL